jgi:hypothetical protein
MPEKRSAFSLDKEQKAVHFCCLFNDAFSTATIRMASENSKTDD